MRAKRVIEKLIIVLLVVMWMILVFEIVYPLYSYKMDYVQPTRYIGVQYQHVTYSYSRQEVRNKLENILGVNHYIYIEKELEDNIGGYTYPMFRCIVINTNLSELDYVEAICHELIHLKYNTGSERFVQYQTFITLYNSEFKQVAINIIYYLENGYYYYEYDCYAQIVEYLVA